jgi:type IV secretory pathway VirB3-like protein
MRRWAVLVVLLYFLILLALTAPLILVAFYPQTNSRDALVVFSEWKYWAFLGVMMAGQAVMLLVPVDLARQRPTSRRSVLRLVLASGLMMGLLGAGMGASILEFIKQDKALELLGNGVPLLAVAVPVWAVWSIIFYRTGRDTAPMDVLTKQCSYLLKGSILELLVAVPSHIVARARNYCCAGFSTFLGIAFGVSVMLFSFGPAVFFLFAHHWKRLQSQRGHETS